MSQAKFESQAEIEIALTAAMTDPNLSSLPQPTDMIDCRLQPAGQHDIAAVARQGDYYDLCARLPSHCWAYEFISPKPGATWPHSRTVGGDRVHSESPVWIWGATKLLLYSKDWRRGSTLACLSMPQHASATWERASKSVRVRTNIIGSLRCIVRASSSLWTKVGVRCLHVQNLDGVCEVPVNIC